jgi:hypothetical protein
MTQPTPTTPPATDGTWLRTHWRPLLALAFIVLLANAAILSGQFNCDPETLHATLATSGTLGIFPGSACYVDPAVALLTQPMGHLSAQDWLHGIIPWWNPYSGVGMPLAAEMQNESFFLPFVLLLHFHNGWFLQRMLFQLLSAIFTYAFLIRLNLTAAAALLGGALFALNGTFILTAGTVTAPIMFLPLLLLGIEQTWHAARAHRRMGWSLVPLALAGSIYAGFPETAYLNGLLCACWTLLRLAQSPGQARARFLGKMLLGTSIGVTLTLPLVLPFLAYLGVGDTGAHDFGFLAHTTLPPAAAPLQMFPLFYGAIGPLASGPGSDIFQDWMWVRIGGWFGCAPVLLACYALIPKTASNTAPVWRLPARALLAGWILLWEARYFGTPGLTTAFNLIPGMVRVDLIRYSGLSQEFAIFALAACGFDDLARRLPFRRSHLLYAVAGFLACLALSIMPVLHLATLWFNTYPQLRLYALLSFAGAALTTLTLLYVMFRGRGLLAAQTCIIAGGIIIFLLPQFAGLRGCQVDRQGITFLQQNIGLSRFYTTGPFTPNFPAMYGIASLNFVQIPAPKIFTRYVGNHLFPGGHIRIFVGGQPGQIAALQKNLAAYEAIGIKYVGAHPGTNPFQPTGPSPAPSPMPTLAFHSPAMDIYQLPNPAPYAQITNGTCTLAILSRQKMQTTCTTPATLIRREMVDAGWHATVNGTPTPIQPITEIFQQIPLPEGTSIIRFSYLPPHTRLSCTLALLALSLWLGCWLSARKQGQGDAVPLAPQRRGAY